MSLQGIKNQFTRFVILLTIFVLTFGLVPPVHAAALTTISDTLSREKAATASSHTISFATPTGIHSGDTITLTFPAASFTAGAVSGVTINDAGGTDYAVTSSTWATPVLTITASATSIAAAGHVANIKIPSGTGFTNPASASTYIVTIGGNFGDTGSFAIPISANDQVTVGTTVDPYISFTLTTTSVTLTKSTGGGTDFNSTGYNQGGANTLAANTNSATGYSISYNGATLTAGSYTINAMSTKGVSTTGTEQFGINLKDNATPNTGVEPSGSATGVPASDYATADQYRFIAGATTPLATAAGTTTTTTYTVSYIANVTQTTEPAAYSTTITYICTGNF